MERAWGPFHLLQRRNGASHRSRPRRTRRPISSRFDRRAPATAKSWELRAVMSMTRLWRDQAKRDEARDLLAPVYGWFSEGFDTCDLKDAKALLDELAS
jgi:predicted ATPase